MKAGIIYVYLIIFLCLTSAIAQKEDVKKFSGNVKNDSLLITKYISYAKKYRNSMPDSAIFYVKLSLKELEKNDFPRLKAETYNHMAYAYKTKFQLDSAIVTYRKAFHLWTELKDTLEITRVLNSIGNVFFDKGDFNKSISYFNKSIKIKELYNDIKGIGINQYNIGNNYMRLGNYKMALENYTKAKETFNSMDTVYEVGIASCLNSIGILYNDWVNYPQALKNFNQAKEIETKNNNTIGIINIETNIGNVYVKIHEYDTALVHFNHALGLSIEVNDIKNQAVSLKNIGLAFSDKGNYDRSIIYLMQALEISRRIQIKDVEVIVLQAIGYVYTYQLKCNDALTYLLESSKIAEEIGYKEMMGNNYTFISQAYMCVGDGEKANYYYKKSVDESNNTNLKLNELRIKYETEKQEKEIELLNKQQELNNAQLIAQEAVLKNNRIVMYVFIVGFILFMIFSIIVTRQYRQKKKANVTLALQNDKIRHQNEEITSQRDKLSEQKQVLEEQKTEIEDSINYALRIQQAVLPADDYTGNILDDHFIFFRPKYIVSGDFYWAVRIENFLIVTVADCTGHGVPGAFMSMLGVSFLNEIVRKNELTKASEVLDHLRESIIDALKQKGLEGEQKDGMDISLCVINTNTLELQYAGANNPLYIIRKKAIDNFNTGDDYLSLIEEIKPDKMPVAIYFNMHPFTNHCFQMEKEDRIYMFSDGYPDQFGGEKGKKFMYKSFKRLLGESSSLPMKQQFNIINNTFNDWTAASRQTGGHVYEQIDDITVFGMII
ncbi:MAG: tetratricopeptide repeat protein [Bacteroidota bacterium]